MCVFVKYPYIAVLIEMAAPDEPFAAAGNGSKIFERNIFSCSGKCISPPICAQHNIYAVQSQVPCSENYTYNTEKTVVISGLMS